ncbi:MAG: AraC family transcriptional regulator [Acidobacteriaceae bacterium]|nr:AraC family transcriptional regulator [Acidobacteriaceae bacterium]
MEPQISVMHLECGPEHAGLTEPVPPEDVFSVGINPTEIPNYELLSKRGTAIKGSFSAYSMRIVSLADEVRARLFHPHETVCFYIPRASLDAITDEEGLSPVGNLSCMPGIIDPTMTNLVKVLLLSLNRPQEADTVFINQMMLTVCSHLIERYSDNVSSSARTAGSDLTPSATRRAQEMLADNLKGNITVGDLARECGITRLHLIGAFKKTTGCTPHQWLQQRRIDQARHLLKNTELSVHDIALQCGFVDQIHLSRVFNVLVQTTPEAWRQHNND